CRMLRRRKAPESAERARRSQNACEKAREQILSRAHPPAIGRSLARACGALSPSRAGCPRPPQRSRTQERPPATPSRDRRKTGAGKKEYDEAIDRRMGRRRPQEERSRREQRG